MTTLTYDPTGAAPANLITDELQASVSEAGVIPTEAPFYKKDFQLFATRVADDVEQEMTHLLDFTFSPSFISVAAITGVDVFTFFVLLKPTLFKALRYTYRGVGGSTDATLLQELVDAEPWDRTDPKLWMRMLGETIALRTASLDVNYRNLGALEQLGLMFDKLAQHLERPAFVLSDVAANAAQAAADAAEIKAQQALDNSLLGLYLVDTPVISSPLEASTGYNYGVGVATDPFAINDITYDGLHASTDWEVSDTSDFAIIRSSSYDNTEELVTWHPDGLTVSTLYYIRCRHRSDSHMSDWSTVISFTTGTDLAYPANPSLIAPLNTSTDIALLPVLQSSAFTVVDGTDTHASTDWQIASDNGFTSIVYQALASGDLLSHTVATDLSNDTVYYVRVRHNGVSYTSDWSSVIQFTTTDFIEAVLLIGGAGSDIFQSIVIDDTTGNYVCVGGSGNDAYIAIFDTNLVLQNNKLIVGGSIDYFYRIIIDPNNGNYVCVGHSSSAGAGLTDAYIAIFDTDLLLVKDRLIGGAGTDEFRSVAVDPTSGNYVCVGYSDSAGAGVADAYLAIFDTDLNLINSRLTGGAGSDIFQSIVIDPNTGNYICVGSAVSGPTYGYIIIFDTDLNIIDDKFIGGASNSYFLNISIDPNNGNYVCVGYSDSAGAGLTDAYIAIFDTSLSLINDKLIGGTDSDLFQSIVIDPNTGNYVFVGYFDSEGAGLSDAYIAVMDTSLNLISDKLIGGAGSDIFQSIVIDDTTGNYVCVGYSASAGAGSNDAMVMTFLRGLTLADGNIPSITELSVSSPAFTETSPTFTETSPTFTEINPTLAIIIPVFTETSPTFTVTNPTLTETFSLY